jgi:GNAT superfamily N-acetyltransferase
LNPTGYTYRAATANDLELIWNKNIADNQGDGRWVYWKSEILEKNKRGVSKSFVVLYGDAPVGEGTLVFSPECLHGRPALADHATRANISGLRMDKRHEGKGHISKLVKMMERHARDAGYKVMTIGVEAKETRNLGIYLHWGYDTFVMSAMEDDELVLYYLKEL